MAKKRKRENEQIELNLTSMMDVVFQLIIFFILVTNFAAAELPKLETPDFDNSKAQETKYDNRLMINVVPFPSSANEPGKAQSVMIGAKVFDPESREDITQFIKDEKEKRDAGIPEEELPTRGVQVNLRADQSIEYEEVAKVMQAITMAGIRRINLVAKMDEKK